VVGYGRAEGALEPAAADGGGAAVALGAEIGAAAGAAALGIRLDGAARPADEAVELRLGTTGAAADAAAEGRRTRYLASRPAGAIWSLPVSASAWWAGSPQ
jgi:hypothetical protein